MVQDGKITAEEGARLLTALRESAAHGGQAPGDEEVRKGWLRVRVTDIATGKTKVNLNLPLGLLDAGMNIATRFVPEMNLSELTESIKQGNVTGKVIDVIDEGDGEHVEIYVE